MIGLTVVALAALALALVAAEVRGELRRRRRWADARRQRFGLDCFAAIDVGWYPGPNEYPDSTVLGIRPEWERSKPLIWDTIEEPSSGDPDLCPDAADPGDGQ